MNTLCGCGRPARYMSLNGDDSCNKYGRCPTYEELEKNTGQLYGEHLQLINAIKAFDKDRKSSSMFKMFELIEELTYGKD